MTKTNKWAAGLFLVFSTMLGCNNFPAIRIDARGSALEQAESLFETGRYSEAAESYRKILRETPPVPEAAEAQYLLAFTLSYYKNPQQDYAASLKEYQKAASRYPKSPYRRESENMISLLSSLVAQKQQLIDEQAKTKQLEENLLRLQQLEIETEQRRVKPKQD
ncbi:MAG: outer membrane protein assembly factor BamD [Nitrospirae bacterium]|nr:outer membrane protein assembly factor BamD [Nitrospirota bacterium]